MKRPNALVYQKTSQYLLVGAARTNLQLWKLNNSIVESTNVLTELMQKQHAGRCICKEPREFVLESSTKQGPKKNRTTTESEIDSIKPLTRLISERATARVMERVHSPSSWARLLKGLKKLPAAGGGLFASNDSATTR